MHDPKSEGGKDAAVDQNENVGEDAASTVNDAMDQADPAEDRDLASELEDGLKEIRDNPEDLKRTEVTLPVADSDMPPNPTDQTAGAISAEEAEKDAQAEADSDAYGDGPVTETKDEPIPAQTIDILAPFVDNQISVIMYDREDRISRVARTAQGTTLRFVFNEHERLFVSVADPEQHDKYRAMFEEDAADRG